MEFKVENGDGEAGNDEDSQCDHIRHKGVLAKPSGLTSQ
jgi:hypothetical protein